MMLNSFLDLSHVVVAISKILLERANIIVQACEEFPGLRVVQYLLHEVALKVGWVAVSVDFVDYSNLFIDFYDFGAHRWKIDL
jgi:hypothetical protein